MALERIGIACTASGGSPTVREGMETESTPSLTVGLPPLAANPVHSIETLSKLGLGISIFPDGVERDGPISRLSQWNVREERGGAKTKARDDATL